MKAAIIGNSTRKAIINLLILMFRLTRTNIDNAINITKAIKEVLDSVSYKNINNGNNKPEQNNLINLFLKYIIAINTYRIVCKIHKAARFGFVKLKDKYCEVYPLI